MTLEYLVSSCPPSTTCPLWLPDAAIVHQVHAWPRNEKRRRQLDSSAAASDSGGPSPFLISTHNWIQDTGCSTIRLLCHRLRPGSTGTQHPLVFMTRSACMCKVHRFIRRHVPPDLPYASLNFAIRLEKDPRLVVSEYKGPRTLPCSIPVPDIIKSSHESSRAGQDSRSGTQGQATRTWQAVRRDHVVQTCLGHEQAAKLGPGLKLRHSRRVFCKWRKFGQERRGEGGVPSD
jgi:hypothetical protein